MRKRLGWVTRIALLLFCTSLSAAELTLSTQELERLGVDLATPTVAEHVAVVAARARVVIPPKGEQVVTAVQAGTVAQLNVGIGDAVQKGQVLATVQSPAFLTLQREYIDAFNADDLARSQIERDQQLFDEGIISKRRLEDTEARSKTTAAQLGEQRALLRFGGMRDAELAALATEQRFADRLIIRAPVAGVVLERMSVIGEQVDVMEPVYRIGDLSRLWLDIQVPQEQIASVTVGMSVAVADCVVALPAIVMAIGQAVDPVSQTVTVRAELVHPDHQLKPGQFVSVQIVSENAAGSTKKVWTVPVSAIVRRDDQCYVFVRTEDGFEAREVNIVGTTGDQVYLDGGVSAESRIVMAGVSALKAIWSNQMDSGN